MSGNVQNILSSRTFRSPFRVSLNFSQNSPITLRSSISEVSFFQRLPSSQRKKKRRKKKARETERNIARHDSIRPFIVEAALSRQVEPNYKNSSVARPVICLAHGPPLFTSHRFHPLLPPLDPPALPFYFSFIAGLSQLQLRNALALASAPPAGTALLRFMFHSFGHQLRR